MSLNEVVIVSALRTPIGTFNGTLRDISAVELGAKAIKSVIEEVNIKVDNIDEVIMGNVLQAGLGQNPARQASIKAGLTEPVPAYKVNKVCSSGLKSVQFGDQTIMIDDAEKDSACGMQSYRGV